ncbi:MAG: hypothetical protein IJQ85_00070 [Selenomonadaceae bacterium]|nr:hypothetical protein [Selenomonadaceae bacterium]
MNENFAAQNANENSNFNGQQPRNFDRRQSQNFGRQQAPSFDGQQAPNFDGQQPRNFDRRQSQNFGGQQAPSFDGQQMPGFNGQQPDNMWGNFGFANDEIFNGENNFDFGVRNDITAITNSGAELPANFAEQNTFGNFGQGGMMPPPMFGNAGGQSNQPQQASPRQAE